MNNMQSMQKMINILKLFTAVGGVSTLGVAAITTPIALIPCIGVWYYLFVKPLRKVLKNKDLAVTKITITPEKDKLILEYGYPQMKTAEVEIENLDAEVKLDTRAKQSFRTVWVYLDKERKSVIKVGIPQTEGLANIPNKELLMNCLFGRTNLLEHYVYEPEAKPN